MSCHDFDILAAAARTKNYSGAELEGVVKSAVSFALNRQISMDDLTKPLDEESIKVTMDDFLHALQEIVPAFGASTDDLERCRYSQVGSHLLVVIYLVNTLLMKISFMAQDSCKNSNGLLPLLQQNNHSEFLKLDQACTPQMTHFI